MELCLELTPEQQKTPPWPIKTAQRYIISPQTFSKRNHFTCGFFAVILVVFSCCGAGTAADTSMTTEMISSQLELHRLFTNRTVRVATANQMLKQYLFRYQGHVGAALVLGGVDVTGPHIYCIFPHGSSDTLPYATMGSGSLAAMAVFESRYKENMEEKEAIQLVRDAIAAGIFNDLGSGSNVDICVIRKGSVDYLRTYDEANKKGVRQNSYRYPRGTTAVLKTEVIQINEDGTTKRSAVGTLEAMDTSS